ncbi:unnamed protein product (macronuclear) [Paramecium tetraurelia]|uniref:Uncharacterized protein n=1 Tax=Paramecium tetraurelia TaxID=5888 RepID=A0BE48_PARTE|nr:uncharacterized protein GSPATT00027847001 [Paramecium tetraurelia]CAK56815.1 unnamed protein product [Paramecium tetraurelia]|eukprot:XP_001424213.1 hypothetical protein (macronuclear) [Paramecium tetraurelia strain d4-2]
MAITFLLVIIFLVALLFMAPNFITKIIRQPRQQEQTNSKLTQMQILNQLFDQKANQNSKSKGCITLRGEIFNEEQQEIISQLTSICDVICLSRTDQPNLPKGMLDAVQQQDHSNLNYILMINNMKIYIILLKSYHGQ